MPNGKTGIRIMNMDTMNCQRKQKRFLLQAILWEEPLPCTLKSRKTLQELFRLLHQLAYKIREQDMHGSSNTSKNMKQETPQKKKRNIITINILQQELSSLSNLLKYTNKIYQK